jgi:large exoprotein involved in heme utilization and adhesion
VTRADALLRNGGDINVKGDGGSIRILAQDIDVTESSLRIEIPSDSRFLATRTGDLELNATGSITIRDGSLANSLFGQGTMGGITLTAGDRITISGSALFSTAEPDGSGAIGDVTITARTILFDNALLVANTSQQTDASDVFINARDTVSFNGSLVFNAVEQTGSGNGGDINITTGSLALTEGTQLLLFTRGQGNVGDINIDARGTVSLDSSSYIFNTVEPNAVGNGGDVNVTTGSFTLTDGAQLILNTSGKGDSGNVNINARDTVSLAGSSILNTVEPSGVGNGGDVNVTTGSFTLTDGAQLILNTSGKGDSGNVNINARDTASLSGSGSYIFNTIEQTAVGNGGDVNVTTGSLTFIDGARLILRTKGKGNLGNVNINARNHIFLGNSSAVFNTVNPGGIGHGGDINIITGLLTLTNASELTAATFSQGNAGDVNISVRDTVTLDGGTTNVPRTVIASSVGDGGVGNGGSINIQAQQLTIRSNAALAGDVLPTGRGQGGDINLDISGTILLQGGMTADTGESARITLGLLPDAIGTGGDLRIRAGALVLQDGGLVKASTQGQGDAGNIDIRPVASLSLAAFRAMACPVGCLPAVIRRATQAILPLIHRPCGLLTELS